MALRTLRTETYAYKIQKSCQDLGMSGEAKTESNNLMIIFTERLMERSNSLARTDESKTLGTRDLENAVRIWLVRRPEFTDKLCDYAHSAVTKFYTKIEVAPPSKTKSKKSKVKPVLPEPVKPLPKSNRAGITMPVTRLEHYLRKATLRDNVSEKASVFFAALLDKVCQEICTAAGVKAINDSKQRVTHKHISSAIRSHPDLSLVFKNVVLGGGTDLFIPF